MKEEIKRLLALILGLGSGYFIMKRLGSKSNSVIALPQGNDNIQRLKINGAVYVVDDINNPITNDFLKSIKNNEDWKNIFCSKDAKVCVTMNKQQLSVARFLLSLIKDAGYKNGANHTITSGIRDANIINVLMKKGFRVSPKTDHTYGMQPNPDGKGAIDVTFGSKTKKVYSWIAHKMQAGEKGYNKIYQLIYYPNGNFIHMSYIGNRNQLADNLRYLWMSDKPIDGKYYHPALGIYA